MYALGSSITTNLNLPFAADVYDYLINTLVMLRFESKGLEYVAVPGVVGPLTTKSKNQALIVSNNFGNGDELP